MMLFITLALTAITCAMAAPAPEPADEPSINPAIVIFGVVTRQPGGGELDGHGWGAMKKGIFTGDSPQVNASCSDGKYHQFATFLLNKDENGTLYLHTDGKPWQQIYVDRSAAGQGMMQYTTGAEAAPANAERSGFAINGNNFLTFDNHPLFLACPGGPNKSFRVLPYVGNNHPAGYANCQNITATALISQPDPKAVDPQYPVQCYYSTE